MNSIDETFVGSIFEDIIKNNIKNFVKLVNQGAMTKEAARARLRAFAGADIELPPELLDDEPKLPPNAEFIV